MNYKGFDGTAWRWCGIAVIILGFAISAFEIWGMWQVGSIGVPSVKNQLIAVAIGLIVFAVQVILQAKGCRQLMYSVVANKVGNEATPCEKAQNKQILLWSVFVERCIFVLSYFSSFFRSTVDNILLKLLMILLKSRFSFSMMRTDKSPSIML